MLQKWEYCVITGLIPYMYGIKPNYPYLTYLSLKGIETPINLGHSCARKRPQGWQKASEEQYVAHVIAKLGVEGWEMVGTATTSSHPAHCIYFRRPIEMDEINKAE